MFLTFYLMAKTTALPLSSLSIEQIMESNASTTRILYLHRGLLEEPHSDTHLEKKKKKISTLVIYNLRIEKKISIMIL